MGFWNKNVSSPFEKEKVFCIGANKTGTTSLEKALAELGYKMGNQVQGEMLLKEYAKRNFQPVIDFCHTADAFQDVPFSYPFTFLLLDHYFPNAKFILSVRDNSDQWYESMVSFHSKLFGNGNVPTEDDLKKAVYHYPGRPWESNRVLFNTPPGEPYHKPTLVSYYERHNKDATEYFRLKNNFICVNISDPGDYTRMCTFLGKTPIGNDFPWLNKT